MHARKPKRKISKNKLKKTRSKPQFSEKHGKFADKVLKSPIFNALKTPKNESKLAKIEKVMLLPVL